MPLLLQNWVLAIPTLIDRKPVQKKWIGEKCGFFQPLVSSMAQRKVSISRHSALSEWLEQAIESLIRSLLFSGKRANT